MVLVVFPTSSRSSTLARRFTRIFTETIENVNLQKLPLGRLQTPREQNDRVPLEEEYIFDVAIPPKDGFEHYNKLLVRLPPAYCYLSGKEKGTGGPRG